MTNATRNLAVFISVIAVSLIIFSNVKPANGGKLQSPYPLPEFTGTADDWINSDSLKVADLRGNVVLIDFWTFDCWNCYRSFPWLNDLEERYQAKGLKVIGVHTPEFEHEKVRGNVERKIQEFELKHPVMMDNNFTYWRALNNRYWPAFYLVDKTGQVRAHFIGETHKGDKNAMAIEATIETLLAESI